MPIRLDFIGQLEFVKQNFCHILNTSFLAPELYVTACILCYGCEKIRTLIATEPSGLFSKFWVWHNDTKWNICDTVAILLYLVAFGLRSVDDINLRTKMVEYARVIYATDICYWYVRSLRLIGKLFLKIQNVTLILEGDHLLVS